MVPKSQSGSEKRNIYCPWQEMKPRWFTSQSGHETNSFLWIPLCVTKAKETSWFLSLCTQVYLSCLVIEHFKYNTISELKLTWYWMWKSSGMWHPTHCYKLEGLLQEPFWFHIFCYQDGRHYAALNNCTFPVGYTASHLMEQNSSRHELNII